MRLFLPDIRHDYAGFEVLVDLYGRSKNSVLDHIEIDLGTTFCFDADMCAPLGAILYQLGVRLNTINLSNIRSKLETILSKNGFLTHYGHAKLPDLWKTTLSYRRFDTKDDRYFADYIENELIHRPEMPTMSTGLMKKFRESIFEIFSNAVLHSRTELGIFSCGQFFPKRNRLDFSIADLGVGMRQNIRDALGLDFPPQTAIDWATQGRNTTKRGRVPGGLGLKLLIEFIDFNGGCIQIVSDAGYWRRENRNTVTASLKQAFPGTVVVLEINTADRHSYALDPEPNVMDIF